MSVVDDYNAVASQLITEATKYAQAGVYDEATASNIRSVQVMTQVLQAALLQGSAVPRPPPQPPGEPAAATHEPARRKAS